MLNLVDMLFWNGTGSVQNRLLTRWPLEVRWVVGCHYILQPRRVSWFGSPISGVLTWELFAWTLWNSFENKPSKNQRTTNQKMNEHETSARFFQPKFYFWIMCGRVGPAFLNFSDVLVIENSIVLLSKARCDDGSTTELQRQFTLAFNWPPGCDQVFGLQVAGAENPRGGWYLGGVPGVGPWRWESFTGVDAKPGDLGLCQQEPAYSLPLCCTWRSFEGRPVLAFTGGGKCRKKPAKVRFVAHCEVTKNSRTTVPISLIQCLQRHLRWRSMHISHFYWQYTRYIWFLRFKFIHIHIIYILITVPWHGLHSLQSWLLRGAPPGHHVDVPIADSLAFGFRQAGQISEIPDHRTGIYAQEIQVLRYLCIYICTYTFIY